MYKIINPLIADDSGEVLYSGYHPWWFEGGVWTPTTPSMQMVLSANAKLYLDGDITLEQAQFNEFHALVYGFMWADKKPAKAETKSA